MSKIFIPLPSKAAESRGFIPLERLMAINKQLCRIALQDTKMSNFTQRFICIAFKERLLCISDTSARKLITAFFTFRIFQVDYLTKRILFIQAVIGQFAYK